ncbi:mechanosensitive ion channel domain-containing protein [Phytopseudomonas dryadis]|uniref:Small-conductance mechanosensitive channel n=1 Tax=Phytopseudomonas dryadis TaxID=2487520 RepID=A0A4Q9QNW5_9GAMM|nr:MULTISPECIES: mechanosensitive ion channel family protein [Pseudomonas]TBU81889.1 mechanosensitive ion channel family protein [Pseudomonas dryadis]TBV06548.1 mechanosensitive ion channel family protein [Pseudomonas dryadis]TBV18015.1 mechanosensitive ion channel family protein [Pseudomonas sp. FRB 230]
MIDWAWLVAWSQPLMRIGQVVLILVLAWLAQRILTRGITRLGNRYPQLPPELLMPLRGLTRWLILGSAFMLVLERLGVSAQVLWTALTGFVAVAAIAFFAIWSVLSNLFCALLIFALGPFRIGDCVEVLESADKPGVRGRVLAINLFYTTLEDLTGDAPGTWVQIPNSLFFQKAVRRWRNGDIPAARRQQDG